MANNNPRIRGQSNTQNTSNRTLTLQPRQPIQLGQSTLSSPSEAKRFFKKSQELIANQRQERLLREMKSTTQLYESYLNDLNIEENKIEDITEKKQVDPNLLTRGLTPIEVKPIDPQNTKIFKEQLTKRIFDKPLDQVIQEIEIEIQKMATINNAKQCSIVNDKWIDCIGSCETILIKYLNMEINSVAYILRVINASFVRGDGLKKENVPKENVPKEDRIPFKFLINKKVYSDVIYGNIPKKLLSSFKLVIEEPETTDKVKEARLIMGFGPSASGKTFCAKSIIKMIGLTDSNFPKVFFTIDGGEYRKQSIIYQYIIKSLIKNGLEGFTNMKVGAVGLKDLFGKSLKSLFDSSSVKKVIGDFLNHQKKEYKTAISLYIPETLGKCKIKNCRQQYQKYIDFTGDKKWIALYIYQHKHDFECIYPGKYKCVGTTTSGIKREIDDGKKYSSKAYETSESYGLKHLLRKETPIKFKIHNSGEKAGGLSIIEDLNEYSGNNPFLPFLEEDQFIDTVVPSNNLRIKLNKFKNTNTNMLDSYRYIKISKICIAKNIRDELERLERNDFKKAALASANQSTNNNDDDDENTGARKYLKYKMKYLKLKNELNININIK
jgi:hypothetical protein